MTHASSWWSTQAIGDVVKREIKPLFLGAATFAGTSTFLLLLERICGSSLVSQVEALVSPAWMPMYSAMLALLSALTSVHWSLLAIPVTLIALPNVYTKLKNNKEPLCIRFARAFALGFLALSCIVPDLSKWVLQVKGLLKRLPGMGHLLPRA